MITGWRTPYLMAMVGIALSVAAACTFVPTETSPQKVATAVPTTFTLVTPTPEPPDLVQMRLATVEAAANEARVSPGYVWTQTCERFRSTQSGCRTGR